MQITGLAFGTARVSAALRRRWLTELHVNVRPFSSKPSPRSSNGGASQHRPGAGDHAGVIALEDDRQLEWTRCTRCKSVSAEHRKQFGHTLVARASVRFLQKRTKDNLCVPTGSFAPTWSSPPFDHCQHAQQRRRHASAWHVHGQAERHLARDRHRRAPHLLDHRAAIPSSGATVKRLRPGRQRPGFSASQGAGHCAIG